MSALSKLYRYRGREKRNPFEDFLSEVLTSLLSCLPPAEAVRFLRACFVPKKLQTAFDDIALKSQLSFRTQVHTDERKRLDIVIECQGKPLIVIENKLYAQFQMHDSRVGQSKHSRQTQGGEDQVFHNQLITYGRWLVREKRRDEWPGVISLLTHATLPPSDFMTYPNAYHAHPHVIHWRDIHAHLASINIPEMIPSKESEWVFLASDLKKILEDNQMDSSEWTSVDLSALNLFMTAGRRFAPVMTEISSTIQSIYPQEFTKAGADFEIDEYHSRAWGWTFFQGKVNYVAYGTYFVPLVGDFQRVSPPLPAFEHAFICIGTENEQLRTPAEGLPAGWHSADDGVYLIKPLSLSSLGGRRFAEFIRDEIAKEIVFIRAIHAAST